MIETYRAGDMIPSAPIFAIEQEYNYCPKCSAKLEFFVTCSYGVYLGIFSSYKEAKRAIDNFGMEELLKFYAQRVSPKRGLWYGSPVNFMQRLIKYYDNPPPKREGKFATLLKHHDFKEDSPLEAIKNDLKQDELSRSIRSLYSDKIEFDMEYAIIDETSAKVYNPRVQEQLGRDCVFEVKKIEKHQEGISVEDYVLTTYSDLNKDTILDSIQYWLDLNNIYLEAIMV